MREHRLLIDEVGSPDAPPGSREWAIWTRMEIQGALKNQEVTATHLRDLLRGLERYQGYAALVNEDGQPFTSYHDFCVARIPFGLGHDPVDIDRLIKDRHSAQQVATLAKLGPRRGEVGRGRVRSVDNRPIGVMQGSTNVEYLTSLVARDAPEILERMKAGAYPSVRAAARDAGLVKDRWSVPAHSIQAMADYLARRLSAEDVLRLKELL